MLPRRAWRWSSWRRLRGQLAKGLPAQFNHCGRAMGSAAHWAFRWVCNFPEVTVVLSGMGTMDEVKENIATMSEAAPTFTEEELALFKQAQAFFLERTKVKCTTAATPTLPPGRSDTGGLCHLEQCGDYDRPDEGRWHYRNLLEKNKAADQCAACGQCESVCPQNLAIIELLQKPTPLV